MHSVFHENNTVEDMHIIKNSVFVFQFVMLQFISLVRRYNTRLFIYMLNKTSVSRVSKCVYET